MIYIFQGQKSTAWSQETLILDPKKSPKSFTLRRFRRKGTQVLELAHWQTGR